MATRSILLINGPNLNMLGTREPEIYGNTTLADIERDLIALGAAGSPALTITTMQSNHEGEIIDAIHAAGKDADGIIINAGAFTHYSIAIRDALDSIATPFVEVHISNVYKREEFRHHSVLSAIADGVIVGFGVDGYRLALEWFRGELSNQP